MIVVYAEKPDVGTRIAATLGGCFINGHELTPGLLSNPKYEGMIKRERYLNGYFECKHKNKKYIVTWGYGHMAELKHAYEYDLKYKSWKEENFPFIPDEYEIRLKSSGDTKKQFKLIKDFFKDPDTEYIIAATDSDREGQNIFDYVYQLTGSKKLWKRLWISSYTEEAILEGFKNLRDSEDMKNLGLAAKCRSNADWVVGNNATVLATIKYGGYKNMVSLGRVQTPTLSILVNRELEIRNFIPETYYEIIATFKTKDGELYKGKWRRGSQDRLEKKEDAENILSKVNGHDGNVTVAETYESKENPPLLYDLSTLQMEANYLYSLSAKRTLDIAQSLYEKQYITYHRTNSRYLSTDLKPGISKIVEALPSDYKKYTGAIIKSGSELPERYYDDSKVEGHHAIIPTYMAAVNLNTEEMKIYKLVAMSFISAFLPDAIWKHKNITTEVEGETFYSSGKTLIYEGWRALYSKNTEADELPDVKVNDEVKGKKYEMLEKETRPPGRYTEKSLLYAMKTAGKHFEDPDLIEAALDHGIGTEATRANIIERIIEVGYVERKARTLFPTEKGIKTIVSIPIDELKSPELTGEWEYKLNMIAKGKYDAEKFSKEIEEFTVTMGKLLKGPKKQKQAQLICKCGSQLTEGETSFKCINYDKGECSFAVPKKIFNKTINKEMIEMLVNKSKTNTIKGWTIEEKDIIFDAALCLIKKDGKYTVDFTDLIK